MLAGAEGAPGIDLQRHGVRRNLVAVRGRMNEEAAGMDRFQPGLAESHPILFGQPLDDRFDIARARPPSFQCSKRVGAWRLIEIAYEHPSLHPPGIRPPRL